MKVVVFGGSGFIGSHIADELSKRGHEVTIFDIKPSQYLKENQKMITGDLLDENAVRKAVKGSAIVYNLGGVADLDEASNRPIDTIRINILGNAYLLEACKDEGVKRFVYSSSIYVYSTLGGFYRCSKQAAETYIEEYGRKYSLDFTILRYGTVYGPRAGKNNSIHRYLKQALDEGKIVCPGAGDEIREYIHVKDVAKLSVDILADEYRNSYVTITGHHPIKYGDMLRTIKEMLGNKIDIEFVAPKENSGHYSITPYSFVPKLGKKLVDNHYIDLGQGLLECLAEIQEEKGGKKSA